MISDNDLYTLAVFLGCLSMLLIIVYHFLEVNAIEEDTSSTTTKTEGQSRTGKGELKGEKGPVAAAGPGQGQERGKFQGGLRA
ncbi:MAG: hypothetical protein L6R37_000844 [Teloschistes peruensis]|nr:MAG: hypothetical protein L6R37_000844 [Teloschistes peruensis]